LLTSIMNVVHRRNMLLFHALFVPSPLSFPLLSTLFDSAKNKTVLNKRWFLSLMDIGEIERILAEHKKELYEKYTIKRIGVFGSFVRGENKKESDIDILVEFEEVPGLLRFIEIEEYLSRILGRKVDLVRKPAIRKELKDRILNEVVYV